MEQLFEPEVRDRAIETTCSNLIMAGLLETQEIIGYTSTILKYSDIGLAKVLVQSRLRYDDYLENCWVLN